MGALLAHQGGWDEALVLVAPVVLFAVIRLLEKRRRPADPETPGPVDHAGPEA